MFTPEKFWFCFLIFIYLLLAALSLLLHSGISLAAGSRGYSLVVVHWFPLQRFLLFCSTGSRAHGLNSSLACGIFPDQGLNLRPLHWKEDS